MAAVEWWAMRIVPGSTPPEREYRREGLASGRFQLVNGDVVEPLSCWGSEGEAIAAVLRETAKTGIPHKVVMSADVDALT